MPSKTSLFHWKTNLLNLCADRSIIRSKSAAVPSLRVTADLSPSPSIRFPPDGVLQLEISLENPDRAPRGDRCSAALAETASRSDSHPVKCLLELAELVKAFLTDVLEINLLDVAPAHARLVSQQHGESLNVDSVGNPVLLVDNVVTRK